MDPVDGPILASLLGKAQPVLLSSGSRSRLQGASPQGLFRPSSLPPSNCSLPLAQAHVLVPVWQWEPGVP